MKQFEVRSGEMKYMVESETAEEAINHFKNLYATSEIDRVTCIGDLSILDHLYNIVEGKDNLANEI